MSEPKSEPVLRAVDLRGILHYVPMFRGHTFVLALDAGVVLHENLTNLLTDIAVMRSLQIRLVIVHGVGQKMRDLAAARKVAISDEYGYGPTDDATFNLAVESAGWVAHDLISSATQAGLRLEFGNGLRAVERGTIKGRDYQHTGRVDHIDADYYRSRIEAGVIPVVGPIAFARDGTPFRLNSDSAAAELAIRLGASKLIYLTRFPGLSLPAGTPKNIPLETLKKELAAHAESMDPTLRSKAEECARALHNGVPRAHILDGTRFGGLLTEIFEKEGIGTMIHANEYEQIRPARETDVQAIFNLTREGIKSDALRPRPLASIEEDLERFFVYEIDDSLIACACLTHYPEARMSELGTVYVHPFYQGRGIGKKMVEYAAHEAQQAGMEKLFALSTQNFTFFKDRADFRPGAPEELPEARRQRFEQDSRGGRILIKNLR